MESGVFDFLSYDDVRDIVKAIRRFFMSLGLNRNEIQIEIYLNRNGVLIFNVFPYGSRAWELLFIRKGITREKLESTLKKMVQVLLPWLPDPRLIDIRVEYALCKEYYGFLKRLVHNKRFLLPSQKHRLPNVRYSILRKQEDATMRVFMGDLYPLLFKPESCRFLHRISLPWTLAKRTYSPRSVSGGSL